MVLFQQPFTTFSNPSINRVTWDWTSDFTVDNWTDSGSLMGVNTGNTRLEWNARRNQIDDHAYVDPLGLLDDTAWVLRFTNDVTTVTEPSSSSDVFFLGIFDSTAGQTTSQDGILISNIAIQGAGAELIQIRTAVGQDVNTGAGVNFSHVLIVETLYYELIRLSSTTTNLELFSDSSYSTSVESKGQTVASTCNGLRYLKCLNVFSGSDFGGNVIGNSPLMRLQDGVTVAP